MQGRFTRSTQIAATPAEAWETLHEVDLLASYSSHLGDVTEVEPGTSWEVPLQDRVGPVKLTAPMRIEIVSETAEEEISIHASGQDRGPGTRLAVEATVRIAESDGVTDLSLEGSFELTGTATRLGAAMARRQAEKMVTEFWSNLTAGLGG